jgi:hypothetical protein
MLCRQIARSDGPAEATVARTSVSLLSGPLVLRIVQVITLVEQEIGS